jgi:hypothetical protein
MATVSRWRSSRPVRLRLELVGFEVFLVALMIFVAGVAELPVFVWFVLAFTSVGVQTVLFYNIGRVRERLEH